MDDRHAVREGMINAGVGDWSSKWGIVQRRNSNEGMRLPIAEGRIAPVGRPEADGGCVKRKAFTRTATGREKRGGDYPFSRRGGRRNGV